MIKKAIEKTSARERINYLFTQAQKRPTYAGRYVGLARQLSTRHKIPIAPIWKKQFCKQCNTFFNPTNVSKRIRSKTQVITCLTCKHHTKIPL